MERLPITLTPHQQAALDWLVDQLTSGSTLVALRGLAGCGKSVMIPFLAERLVQAGIPVTVGAPTHRAAMILRHKGLATADTIHAHALTPYFQPAYAACLRWLGEDCPTREPLPYPSADVDTPLEDDLPTLIADALPKQSKTVRDLLTLAKTYAPKRVLESIGIQGRAYFDGFGAKQGQGCLIIDEASMVGKETLALCQRAFPLICLVGDPGQLPPVKDEAMLATVDGFELVEIHRQAAESPIVQLAYAARNGTADWQHLPCKQGELEEWMAVDAQKFLTAPLIVWRNKVRLSCTEAIRKVLGYPASTVVPGEPLVCRSTNHEDRADGYFNNALFRVVEVSLSQPEIAVVQEDGTENVRTVRLHVEELHGETIHPKAIPFRFAYCLTAHTSQGGEWATVYIAKPDMLAMLGASRTPGREDDGNRWAYTAITRAKQTLGFMLNYDFSQSRSLFVAPTNQETAMPKMTAVPTISEPFLPETDADVGRETHDLDDIPDPLTPLAVVASTMDPSTPAGQMAMSVDQALHKFSTHGATVLNAIRQSWESTIQGFKPNQEALRGLAEAFREYKPIVPYAGTVSVTTPAGYPLSFTVQAPSQEEFMERMGTMLAWFQEQNFTAGAPF